MEKKIGGRILKFDPFLSIQNPLAIKEDEVPKLLAEHATEAHDSIERERFRCTTELVRALMPSYRWQWKVQSSLEKGFDAQQSLYCASVACSASNLGTSSSLSKANGFCILNTSLFSLISSPNSI
jgi:hypothetical protein